MCQRSNDVVHECRHTGPFIIEAAGRVLVSTRHLLTGFSSRDVHHSTTCCLTSSYRRCRGTSEMNNPLIIGLFAFAVILAGAFVGWKVRLPKPHLTDETKNLVSVSMTVVATISALVLGLLISNANTSFIRLGGQVTSLSAEILRLDQILRRYGSDTDPARKTLRQYAEHKAADLFPDHADVKLGNPSTYELLQRTEDLVLATKPANARDQWWLGQAMTIAGKIGDTRWLLAQQLGEGTPKAFVALLIFWLTLLFASFGLFAPHNLTSAVFLDLASFGGCGAIAMFFQPGPGFGKL